MKQIYFEKYTGAGNDFILIDDRKNGKFSLTPEMIRAICDRRFGIGADGILHIIPDSGLDFDLEYYNSDGTGGMLCGNGARCALSYMYTNNLIKNHTARFSSAGLLYSGSQIGEDNYKFRFREPAFVMNKFEVRISGRTVSGLFTDNGARHFVLDFNSIADAFMLNDIKFNEFSANLYGRELRYSQEFMPEGANINFVHIEKGKNYIRTYEKGVESETLACGTGSVAAAFFLNLNCHIESPVALVTKSGESLTVSFNKINNSFEDIYLAGPAKKVFEGIIKI